MAGIGEQLGKKKKEKNGDGADGWDGRGGPGGVAESREKACQFDPEPQDGFGLNVIICPYMLCFGPL